MKQVKDSVREARIGNLLRSVFADFRYALRQLRRAPAFTATALLTLAFGIGVNLGVFQLLYSVILADLPVAHPEELVAIHAARTPFDQAWLVSYSAYQRLRESTPDIPILASASSGEADLEFADRSVSKHDCELVSDNYFSVLGVGPAAGRLFVESDLTIGQSEWPVVVRYAFARDTFGSAQRAVGQHIRLNGRQFVVVGVAREGFLGEISGYAPDIWLPLALQSTGAFGSAFDSLGPGHAVELSKPWYNQPTIFWLSLIARVPAERRAATVAKWDQVFRSDRELMTEATTDPAIKSALLRATTELVFARQGRGDMRERFAAPLTLLMALSVSIFLVGCLNLANLQLARLNARAQEVGLRMALGASNIRILRQIVFEDVLIILAGSAAAFVVGRSAAAILVQWVSSHSRLLTVDLHPSLPIGALGIALMLFSLLSFSILPCIIFMRTGVAHVAGSRAKVAGISKNARQRWRSNLLLGMQVALSLLLSTLSGCFAATLVHWETVDVGMDREHVLSVQVDMDRYRYVDQRDRLPALYGQIQKRLGALPGVRGAAIGMCSSIHCGWNTALYVRGRSDLSNGQVHGQEDHVTPGFFSTVGIPILRGRDFSASDTEETQPVAIISRRYARQLFGDTDPVGQWVGYEPAPNDHEFLIVGEVADAHLNGPENDAPPFVYMNIEQRPAPASNIRVRAMGDPRQISGGVRDALHAVDPTLPIDEIVPLSTELNSDLGAEKLLARLAGIYASLTLLLAAVGFYGVMSSRTARRMSEFGIRLALGASRRNIQMLIVRQTGRILIVGIVPGAILSILAVRAANHFLYGSVSANALAIIAASFVLALAGSVATLIPARRAALADPLEALRSE